MYYSLILALFFLVSRGLFEIVLPKSVAYLINFFGFGFFIVIFIINHYDKFKLDRNSYLYVLGFLTFSFLSMNISLFLQGSSGYVIYIIYPLAISFFYIVLTSVKIKELDVSKLCLTFSLVIYILFIFSVLQQLFIVSLPGDTFSFETMIRPSSLSGSYLHYPLIMVVLSVAVHSLLEKITFPSLLGYMSVFVAFSRSGMMLVSFIFLFIIINTVVHFKTIRVKYIFYTVSISIVIFAGLVYFGLFDLIIGKMFSSVDQTDAGNSERIRLWYVGLDLLSNSNLLIGEHFGEITNLTANLSSSNSIVIESGVLQNLLNFGLLGTLFFYALLFNLLVKIQSKRFKFFLIAFMAESFVYQSTEVFPFIIGSFLVFSILYSIENRQVSLIFKNN